MSKITRFYVYDRNSGGCYLTERADQSNGKYRWIKSRALAVRFNSRSAAGRAARKLGGSVVSA